MSFDQGATATSMDERDAAFIATMRRAGVELNPHVRILIMQLLTGGLDRSDMPACFSAAMRTVIGDELELMCARLVARGAAWWLPSTDDIGAARGTA